MILLSTVRVFTIEAAIEDPNKLILVCYCIDLLNTYLIQGKAAYWNPVEL